MAHSLFAGQVGSFVRISVGKQKLAHVAIDKLKFAPKPVQRPYPPIWVGGEVPAARRRAPARKKQRAFRRTAERGRKMTPRDPLRPGRLAAQKLPVL